MNQNYWAEKQKNQTQMLRVIHDQMNELDQGMHKVADTLGEVASHMGEDNVYRQKFERAHSKRIDILVERIDILSRNFALMSEAILKGLRPQKRIKEKK